MIDWLRLLLPQSPLLLLMHDLYFLGQQSCWCLGSRCFEEGSSTHLQSWLFCCYESRRSGGCRCCCCRYRHFWGPAFLEPPRQWLHTGVVTPPTHKLNGTDLQQKLHVAPSPTGPKLWPLYCHYYYSPPWSPLHLVPWQIQCCVSYSRGPSNDDSNIGEGLHAWIIIIIVVIINHRRKQRLLFSS